MVCIVGSRQVGKSTLLKALSGFRYLTFDDQGLAALGSQNPAEVLRPPCVVDEAQKVPMVFDAVKADVDRERRPGKFVLTGSVRFSRRTMIRGPQCRRDRRILAVAHRELCASGPSPEFYGRLETRAP